MRDRAEAAAALPNPDQPAGDVRHQFAEWAKSDATGAIHAADAIEDTRQRTVARLAVVSRLPNATVSAADTRRWMESWPDEPSVVLVAASDLLAANIDQPTHPPVCECAECSTLAVQP